MSFQPLITFAPVMVLLAWATYVDLRQRRIPNWLTGALLLSGLVQSFLAWHTLGPGRCPLGMAAGFALTFPLFVIRAAGAGDVKLLTALGAWLGPASILAVFVLEKILGLVIVLIQAALQGRLGALLRNSTVLTLNLVLAGDWSSAGAAENAASCNALKSYLPFALPTFLATLLVLGASAFGRAL